MKVLIVRTIILVGSEEEELRFERMKVYEVDDSTAKELIGQGIGHELRFFEDEYRPRKVKDEKK